MPTLTVKFPPEAGRSSLVISGVAKPARDQVVTVLDELPDDFRPGFTVYRVQFEELSSEDDDLVSSLRASSLSCSSSASSSSSISSASPSPMFDSFTGNDGNISDSDSDGTESTREPLTATLKLAFQPLLIRELRDEVEAYEDFDEGLQGEVITRFYGFYEGVEIDDSEEGGGKRKKVAALLIEDIAEGVGRLCSLPLEDRLAIADHFGRMHLAGRQPELDLSGKNLARMHDGSFRVILLHHLKKHICEWDGDWRRCEVLCSEPASEDIKCEALFQCGDELDIWNYHHLPVVYVDGQLYLSFSTCCTTTTEVTVEG